MGALSLMGSMSMNDGTNGTTIGGGLLLGNINDDNGEEEESTSISSSALAAGNTTNSTKTPKQKNDALLLALVNASILCLRDCVEHPIHPSLMYDVARTYFFHAIVRSHLLETNNELSQGSSLLNENGSSGSKSSSIGNASGGMVHGNMVRYFKYRRVCLRTLAQLDVSIVDWVHILFCVDFVSMAGVHALIVSSFAKHDTHFIFFCKSHTHREILAYKHSWQQSPSKTL